MPAKKTAAKSKKVLKKEKVAEISALLIPALSKLKGEIGEKKFGRKIKKAAKLLADGIKPAITGRPSAKKAPLKKAKSGK